MVMPVSTANSVARPCRPPARWLAPERHRQRHQAAAQQHHADDVLGPEVLADQLARHQRDQQWPQPARDRIGVAEIAVGVGLEQEGVVRDVDRPPRAPGTSTAPGSIIGRNGTATRPITVPVVMITPKVASRSDRSDFSSAFQVACISAAASSSATTIGATTIGDQRDL